MIAPLAAEKFGLDFDCFAEVDGDQMRGARDRGTERGEWAKPGLRASQVVRSGFCPCSQIACVKILTCPKADLLTFCVCIHIWSRSQKVDLLFARSFGQVRLLFGPQHRWCFFCFLLPTKSKVHLHSPTCFHGVVQPTKTSRTKSQRVLGVWAQCLSDMEASDPSEKELVHLRWKTLKVKALRKLLFGVGSLETIFRVVRMSIYWSQENPTPQTLERRWEAATMFGASAMARNEGRTGVQRLGLSAFAD